MQNGPLFEQVAADLRRQIGTGELPAGGYLPSVRQLQELQGVSKNTVLTALKALRQEGVIVREGASRHGFRIVGVPEGAEPRETHGVGAFVKLVLPFSYWNFPGSRLLAAIEAELGNREIGTLVGNHYNDLKVESALLQRLIEHQRDAVNALILMTASSVHSQNAPLVRRIAAQMPVLLLDRRMTGFDGHTVTLNNRKLGRVAAEYFLMQGRRRFGFVGGFWNASSVRDRYLGYRESLEESEIRIEDHDLLTLPNAYGQAQTLDQAITRIEKEFDRWSDPPEAILCSSDKSAAAVMRFCVRRGLRLPDDVAIIGCDADEIVAPLVEAKITSFAYPFESVAEELTKLFVSQPSTRPSSWRTIELDPIFVPGDTA